MKLSRDAWVLIVLVLIFGVGFYFISLGKGTGEDSASSYSAGKHGTKALYMLLGHLRFDVSRYTGAFDSIPKDAKVLLVMETASPMEDSDTRTLAKWVKKGNTLIFASYLPQTFGDELRPDALPYPFARYVSVRPVRGPYSGGVNRVEVAPKMDVLEDSQTQAIVKVEGRAVVVERKLGKGRVVFFGDPMMLANSMIREDDNVVLVTNILYRNAGKGERVLFAEYEQIQANRDKPILQVIGRGGRFALAELVLVVLLVVLSAAHRFGAIHPMPEKEERLRGWEFVKAMAGLYRRAGAREAAIGAIYGSLRRDMMLCFGVLPSAKPSDAAETVLRARQVDRARLTALMERCDAMARGRKISDNDAVALARAIEEFRRELGIARSTND